MDDLDGPASGLEQLVNKWRAEFQRPENTDFYTEVDYKEAERRYVKLRLKGWPDV
jgi:hypothetical protein